MKIEQLSKNGFKINNKWFTCDKFKVLDKPLFKSLKIGDVLNQIEYNKKNYVTSFIIVSTNDTQEVKENTIAPLLYTTNTSLKDSPPPTSSLTIVEGGSILEREGNNMKFNSLKSSSDPSVQDRIIFGQCVNIAFEHTTVNGFESEERWIKFSFDRADKIYKEYKLRCQR